MDELREEMEEQMEEKGMRGRDVCVSMCRSARPRRGVKDKDGGGVLRHT